jgi:hypothetical protein
MSGIHNDFVAVRVLGFLVVRASAYDFGRGLFPFATISVAILLLCSGPAHVAVFVVAIVVGKTVERIQMLRLGFGTKFGKELREGLEPELNAPSAVVFPSHGFGFEAAHYRSAVSSKFWSARHAVESSWSMHTTFALAAATLSDAVSKITVADGHALTTVALAEVHNFATWTLVSGWPHGDQDPKSLA